MDSELSLVLISIVVITSGCIGADTETFTHSDEGLEIEIAANHDQETYDLHAIVNSEDSEDLEENPLMDEEDLIEFEAEIWCGLLSSMAYEYEDFQEGLDDSDEIEEESGDQEPTEDETIEEIAPEHMWEDYEAELVEVEIYDKAGEERLAHCQPDEDELNIEVEV